MKPIRKTKTISSDETLHRGSSVADCLSLADTGNRWCVPMNQRVLVATPDENGCRVRLNGIEVVSFFGPHVREWALQEREELARLLNAVAVTIRRTGTA
jgi:hypothetical protein